MFKLIIMENKLINLNELVSSEDFSVLDVNELMRVEGGADFSVLACENTTLCSGGGGITCSGGTSAITCNGHAAI
jgi:hypothetical protein